MLQHYSFISGWQNVSETSSMGNVKSNSLLMSQAEILKSALNKAAEGRATEMTPAEMDAFRIHSEQKAEAHRDKILQKQDDARHQFTQKERDIFSFVRREFNKIAHTAGYDPDKHDALVLTKAAERFGVSADEAKRIFVEVDGAGIIKD